VKQIFVSTVIRNANTRTLVNMVLDDAGHNISELGDYKQACSIWRRRPRLNLLLVESPQTGSSEMAQFRELLKIAPAQSLCLILGIGESALRAEASELGIQHFLEKPMTRIDIESLIDELQPLLVSEQGTSPGLSSAESATPPLAIREDLPANLQLEELGDNRFFLAASTQMMEIRRQVSLLTNADVPVMILGESGSGKEVIARLIHKHSGRSNSRFLHQNCAALPPDYFQNLPSEKEAAGTLLLDQIADMSANAQANLLHFIQGAQFTRSIGDEFNSVAPRIIATSNHQMESALDKKTFREDLYYRLSVFTIHVPPLRERRQEIPCLIDEFIRRSPDEIKGGGKLSFPSRLMDAALLYDWRGNTRELRDFVRWTILMEDPDAALRELETKISATSEPASSLAAASRSTLRSGARSIARDITDRVAAQMKQTKMLHWPPRQTREHIDVSYRGRLYQV
jgi:two-component system, NtrC family, response regulator AtoC